MRLIKPSAVSAILLSAASVFASSATHAVAHVNNQHFEPASTNKIIYGLGLGIGQNNSSINTTFAAGSTNLATGGASFQGFGFVGYQAHISDLYKLSIQADIGYDSLNKSVAETATSSVKIKSGFNYGISARAGMIRGDYTPYLVAGLRVGQWSKSIVSTAAHGGVIPTIANANVLGKKTLVAPELGAGVHFTLSDKVDGRMEYKYFFGGNITKADSTPINTYKLQARQQSVQFSLVF